MAAATGVLRKISVVVAVAVNSYSVAVPVETARPVPVAGAVHRVVARRASDDCYSNDDDDDSDDDSSNGQSD